MKKLLYSILIVVLSSSLVFPQNTNTDYSKLILGEWHACNGSGLIWIFDGKGKWKIVRPGVEEQLNNYKIEKDKLVSIVEGKKNVYSIEVLDENQVKISRIMPKYESEILANIAVKDFCRNN